MTVLLSFLVVSIGVRLNPRMAAPVQLNLLRWKVSKVVTGQATRFIARLFAVGALIVIIVAGMIGDQTPTRNLAPTAIWIAWWVGVSYLSAFIGDVWCVINPWAALFEWYEKSFPIQSASRTARIGWPRTLGVWPATGFFIAFAWIELVWDGRSIPSNLAWLAIGFSAISWAGMRLFGRDTWLRHADPFALAFSVLAGQTAIAGSTQGAGQSALGVLTSAIANVANTRGTLGAFESRLVTAIAGLRVAKENFAAAESRIRDADVAAETGELTRASILQQAGTAVLAQANQRPALALQLLR